MPSGGVFELRWLDCHGRELGFGLFPTEAAVERRLLAPPDGAVVARVARDGIAIVAYARSAEGIWEPASQTLPRSDSVVAARTPY